MAEIWRDVVGYEGLYQVSNLGRVKSFQRGKPRILKVSLNSGGYLYTRLCRDGKHKGCKIHRLVAQAFIPNPDGKPQVNHINGIKADNRAENLEWVTPSENSRHAVATGLQSALQGEEHSNAKLTNEQVRYVRENPDNLSGRELARRFNVNPQTISDVQRGKKYRNVGGAIRTRRPPDPHQVPNEAREEIRREYKPNVRGYDCRALAKKYGISSSVVWNIIHEGKN